MLLDRIRQMFSIADKSGDGWASLLGVCKKECFHLNSNQRIDLRDVWRVLHHLLEQSEIYLTKQISIINIVIKGWLHDFLKDVVDVVIRVKLHFLWNKMKIS